ncbi:uncharacterized protein [Parasteatoda tepidariorum]|uniref:uncharacterized protein n=1 Tax=Parasteatoda tepidariorum TaxID=114398 RepID=UPI00077FDFF8|nr:uncharacterized protein LOC107436778 [Parasteatoda tepidariorum]
MELPHDLQKRNYNSKGKRDESKFKLRDWAEVLAEQKAAEREQSAQEEVRKMNKNGDVGAVELAELAEKLTSAQYGIKKVDKNRDVVVEEQKVSEQRNIHEVDKEMDKNVEKFQLKNWDRVIMEQMALDFHQNGFVKYDLKNELFSSPPPIISA